MRVAHHITVHGTGTRDDPYRVVFDPPLTWLQRMRFRLLNTRTRIRNHFARKASR